MTGQLEPGATHLRRIRLAELELIRPWLPTPGKILEIGAGDGLQAGTMQTWGHEVTAIDIADRPRPLTIHHPVLDYDGSHIPTATDEFNAAFSSNVLEHVRDLSGLLGEIKRVVRPGGTSVHLVPSATWRIATSLSHYAFVTRYALSQVFGAEPPSLPVTRPISAESIRSRRGVLYLLRRALIAGPHGEYPHAIAEIYYFSRRRWLRVFAEHEFEVIHAGGNCLFYSGYATAPSLSWERRYGLARWLGSSCHVFVLRARRGSLRSRQ